MPCSPSKPTVMPQRKLTAGLNIPRRESRNDYLLVERQALMTGIEVWDWKTIWVLPQCSGIHTVRRPNPPTND